MLIYSHLTPQKLLPIAKSHDYIREHTDICDLLDDPNFAIDIDTAIRYNQALCGNPTAIYTFLDGFILSGWALDPVTIDYYKTRCINNPVFTPYINEISRNFYKRYKSEINLSDCLNSPCNYFIPTSTNIGRNADITARLNYSTIPAIPSLTSIPAAVTMGMAELSKIPQSMQRAFGSLTTMTTSVFKNVVNIFNDDPEVTKKQEAAIKSGRPYRSDSIGDVFTSDYSAYFDVSNAASNVLTSIAGDMGDCFRLYQQGYRYNPFDYSQNLQVSNKTGIMKQIDGAFSVTNSNGRVVGGVGDYASSGNNYTLSPYPTNQTDSQLQTTMNGNVVKLYLTVFGGYYDSQTKTLYRDASDKYNSAKGQEYYNNTQSGIGHRGAAYIFTPSLEQSLLNKLAGGYTYNSSANAQQNKFNAGWATDKQTIMNYFQMFNSGITQDQVNQALASGALKAKIKFNGVVHTLPVVDTKGSSSKVEGGTSYRVLDVTADAIVNLFNCKLSPITSTIPCTIKPDVVAEIKNYISFTASSYIAEVQFLIDGVSTQDNALQSSPTSSGSRTSSAEGYPNGKLPDSALTPIGGGHKLTAAAAAKYIEMRDAAKNAGITWGITDSYRSYDAQVDVARRKGLYKEGGLAATPGTSNHGLGKAVDLDLSTAAFQWLKQNAATFQFYNIPRETWHWEYRG